MVGINDTAWDCAVCGAVVFDGEAGCGECGADMEETVSGKYCREHDWFDCPYAHRV